METQERSVIVEVRIPPYLNWEQRDLLVKDSTRLLKQSQDIEPGVTVEEVITPNIFRVRIATNRFFAALLDLVQKDHIVYFIMGDPEVQDNLMTRRKVVARYDEPLAAGVEE